jgi:hypothetical protein
MFHVILLTLLSVAIPFILNFTGIGTILPSIVKGAGGYYLSYYLIEKYFSPVESAWPLILSGLFTGLIFHMYSRTQDDSTGPSALRAEMQGVGFYALTMSVILALS